MAFCNNCGQPLPPGAKFCQTCGAPAGTGASPLPSGPMPVGGPLPPPPPGYLPPQGPATRAPTITYPPIPIPSDLPFALQEGEVLYLEIRPGRRLFWRIFLEVFFRALGFIVFILLFSIPFLILGASFYGGAIIAGIIVVILLVGYIFAWIAYPKFRYWISNHRTVGRRGIVGYSVDSIPLETISDVVVSRTVTDRILGLSSIYVQPFGGGSGGGHRGGGISGTNSFLGVEPIEAPKIQQMVFHLRDVRRRETGRLI
jgi:hypothetical protein